MTRRERVCLILGVDSTILPHDSDTVEAELRALWRVLDAGRCICSDYVDADACLYHQALHAYHYGQEGDA